MKNLIFVRHGQSEANSEGWLAGRINTPLTELGRQEALEAGRLIRKEYLSVDLIVCSPLSRAGETARIIASQIGYPVSNIEVDPDLIELDVPSWEGRPREEFIETAKSEQFVWDEGIDNIRDRAQRALSRAIDLPLGNVLYVAHAGICRMMTQLVKNSDDYQKFWQNNGTKNAKPILLLHQDEPIKYANLKEEHDRNSNPN